MTQFDFLMNKNEYKDIFDACVLAEKAETPSDKALLCRKSLLIIIEYIYKKHNVPVQTNATMLELIDNKTISGFIDNAIILETLHFIRKL